MPTVHAQMLIETELKQNWNKIWVQPNVHY